MDENQARMTLQATGFLTMSEGDAMGSITRDAVISGLNTTTFSSTGSVPLMATPSKLPPPPHMLLRNDLLEAEDASMGDAKTPPPPPNQDAEESSDDYGASVCHKLPPECHNFPKYFVIKRIFSVKNSGPNTPVFPGKP